MVNGRALLPDEELVRVACHSAAGNLVDRRFTLTFHGDDGILGLAGAPGGHAFFDGALVRKQFNSTGAANSVTRSAVGAFRARMPGLGAAGGHVQATAVSPTLDSVRCKVLGWTGGTDLLVEVRCHDAAGLPVDARFVVGYAAV